MKQKLLSMLLAVVMVMGTVSPVSQYLTTAFSANAASVVPTSSKQTLYVNTLGSLRYALMYAKAETTIVLTADIEAVNVKDISTPIGAKGALVLDMNGYNVRINGAAASSDFIKLINDTKLYLLNSDNSVESRISIITDGVEDTSVVSMENASSELFIGQKVILQLGNHGGTESNPDSSTIRVKKFSKLISSGSSLFAGSVGSGVISFEPEKAGDFKNSVVQMNELIAKGYEYCVSFVENGDCNDFFSLDAFDEFKVDLYEWEVYTSSPAPLFRVPAGCNVSFNDVLFTEKIPFYLWTGNEIPKSTLLSVVTDAVETYSDFDGDGIAPEAADVCEYNGAAHFKSGGTYTDTLYFSSGHLRRCAGCGLFRVAAHYTPDSSYVAPTQTTDGRSAGVHCNFPSETDSHYDTSAPIPAKNHIPDTKEIIYIFTEEEFIKSMYNGAPGVTICLMNNLFLNIDDYYGLELVPLATGDMTIDLNGRSIYAESSGNSSLFRLYSSDSDKGAIRLHIVNSESDSTSQIVFRSSSDTASVFSLEHPAVGLYIYPDVKIVNSLLKINDYIAAESSGADTIKLVKFNELEIYGAEIVNNTPKGNCIQFDCSGGNDAFKNSSVELNSSVLRSIDSSIDFGTLPTGALSFDAEDTYFAKAIDNDVSRFSATGDIKVSDILGGGNNLYTNFNFANIVKVSALIKNLAADNEIIISQGINSRCEDHSTREILIDGRYHYLKCDTCGKVVERIEHERIVPDDTGSCEQNIYREYNCECGLLGAVEFTGHDLKRVAATKTDCETAGYLEYYECRNCGALFESPYGGTERELSDFFVPAGEHNCVILTEMHEPDCDDYEAKVWRCSNENCGYSMRTVDNNEYPVGHSSIGGLTRVMTHNGLEPTCTAKGYSGTYYTCAKNDACGDMYKDSSLSQKISENELDIPALGHDFSDGFEYIFDATCVDDTVTRRICKRCSYVEFDVTETDGHFFDDGVYIYQHCEDINVKEYTCEYCDAKKYEKSFPVSGHVYQDKDVITPPGCVSGGTTKISCSNPWCEDFYYEYPSALGGHILKKQDEVPAKCDTDGVKEHYKCTRDGCTELFFDEAGTQKINNPALLKIPMTKCQTTLKLVTKHENSCTEDGWFAHKKCTVCGKTYMPDGVTEFDPFEFMEARGHSLSLRKAKPASCTASGTIAYYECAGQFGCGAKFLDADGNVPVTDVTDPIKEHKLYLVKEKAPSCTERGFKAHYRCEKLCGLYFSDDKGTVVDPDTLFISPAHTPGEWELTKNPAPDSPGVETLKCSVCKAPISTRNVEYVPPEYILGDVDMNGEIKAADARLALRASVGLEPLSDIQKKAADADKNGDIKAADARLILRASVGLEELK